MSALRLSRPGYPTELRLIDDGAVGRVSHSRLGIKGGSVFGAMVVGTSKYGGDRKARPGAHSPKIRPARVLCGKLLTYLGKPCARRLGHGYDCKDAAALERMAEGRRSGVGRW